jgi:hypothetical protein
MALVKVIPEKNGYKGRNISVGVDGNFILSKEIADEVKHISNLTIDFYQDDNDIKDWYLHFWSFGLIPVRVKNDGITLSFHSAEMRRKILNSIVGPIDVRNRVKIIIGKKCVKDSIGVFPLITESIKNQVLPIKEKR